MSEAQPIDSSPAPDPAAIRRLLEADDAASLEELSAWLQANPKTWVATVAAVADTAEGERGFSAEAACEVLQALTQRTPADEETTLRLVRACLTPIAARITDSLGRRGSGKSSDIVVSEHDDALVGMAVRIVTSSRRSKLSRGAVTCLAEAGAGGALVLARAFDAVRSGTKLQIVRSLKSEDVLKLGDNAVASLAESIVKLAEELVGAEQRDAKRFLAELGPVEPMQSAEIGPTDPLVEGQRVFHATWGAGVVVAVDDERIRVDFGSAGSRLLLRAHATLRRAE
jgi:hypothetical protein